MATNAVKPFVQRGDSDAATVGNVAKAPTKEALALADRLEGLASRVGGLRALSEAAFGKSNAGRTSATISRLRSGQVGAFRPEKTLDRMCSHDYE